MEVKELSKELAKLVLTVAKQRVHSAVRSKAFWWVMFELNTGLDPCDQAIAKSVKGHIGRGDACEGTCESRLSASLAIPE